MKLKFIPKIIGFLLLLFFMAVPANAATYTYDALGRLVSVSYTTGQNVSYTYDAAGNILTMTGPPVISSVYVSTGSISATITWLTDVPATSAVVYGMTTALGSTASDLTLTTQHSITLTGLTPQTTYYFEVRSVDASGNLAIDNNGGLLYSFQTAPPDTTPPVISSVYATATDTTATITWLTDEPATSVINYGTTTALGSTIGDSTLTTIHSITLTGLTPQTTYYYEVGSADAAGNLAVDNNGGALYSFTTPGAVHIASISMGITTFKSKGLTWAYATALVTVVDHNGNPIIGATISGHWSGLTADLDTGVTDTLGQVTLVSDTIVYTAGSFIFTVDDVALSGYFYNPAANVETTDSIPDITPPVISSVSVAATGTSATITWLTNEAATSVVNYGTTAALGSTASDATLVTTHSVTLAGLTSGTTYYFEVGSADAAGNLATDNNNGLLYSFTTIVDTTPPVISSVYATATDTTATITWLTDEPATSIINYGTTTALGSTVSDSTLTTTHSITLTGLTASTTYYFEVQSADAAGNLTVNNNGGLLYSFTTTATPTNTLHVASIVMSTTAYKLKGITYTYATAYVTVTDQNGNLISGATVSGHWSGLTTDVDTGITNLSGVVAFNSDPVANAVGTFTFTVDNITLAGYTYDPAANVQTSASITV